ncbi:MAG: hypothetical protein EXR47_03665 [Dehalococcoidia bacterium]|nr:hypothetical protein [Dehalococcoidia bacterium]
MNERQVQEALSDCLDRLAAGASVEECLARHRDLAAELSPLLRTATTVAAASSAWQPSRVARTAGLARVIEAWPNHGARRSWAGLSYLRRPAAVGALLLVAVVLGGWGALTASASTAPGDALYAVKTTRERIGLFFARSDDARALRYAHLAEERSLELERLVQRGANSDALVALSVQSRDRAERAMKFLNLPHDTALPANVEALGKPAGAPATAPVSPFAVSQGKPESAARPDPRRIITRDPDIEARPVRKLTPEELQVRRKVHDRLQRALQAHHQAGDRLPRHLTPAQRSELTQMILRREREWRTLLDQLERQGISLDDGRPQPPR